MVAIDATNIRLTYSDGTEAVTDVSLEIPHGEFFGFLGPNGAGKTTTIKMLVGLLKPTGGEITLNGYDIEAEPQGIRESIGYMAQDTSVDGELTARENIQFACELYGVPSSQQAERIDQLLDLVDLTDVADKKAREFSGGMKKRLDAATALVHQPPIVFLDEPTAGLDPASRLRLWDYFRDINDQGTTIFLTSQYLEEVDQLCERLAVIQDGTIVETDSPEALKQQVGGNVIEVTIADASDETKTSAKQIAEETDIFSEDAVEIIDDGISVRSQNAHETAVDLLLELRNADIPVEGFDVLSPSLDDVFLEITEDDAAEYDTEILSTSSQAEVTQ